MQRGGGGAFVELAVTAYRRVGGQALDPHAAALELGDDRRVGTQLAVGADAEHEPPGQLVEHLVEVLHRQRVALAAPPTADNPVGHVFIDEQATDEQADKLVQVFGGQLGGPMGALAPMVGEMRGVERARIEIDDDGLRHSVRVDDVIDFEIEDIVPFGVETGQPVRFAGMFHPVASDLTMAEARRSRIDAFGISYEAKTGLSTADFSWSA